MGRRGSDRPTHPYPTNKYMPILITLILIAAGAVVLVGGFLGRSQARWEVLNAERKQSHEKEASDSKEAGHELAA